MVHQGDPTPGLDIQSSSSAKEKWEMADVCRLHEPEQGMFE
jgi:hypothetical protein